jgi:hypothetical protein
MSESDTFSLWLTRILDWPQTMAQWLGPMPSWALLSLIFFPSLIALATRIWHLIFPVVMLNSLIALSAISWPTGELRTLTNAFATAFILAFLGQGLRQRAHDYALAQLQGGLDGMKEQMLSFLEALDRRAKAVEENAVEMAKLRLRAEDQLRRR